MEDIGNEEKRRVPAPYIFTKEQTKQYDKKLKKNLALYLSYADKKETEYEKGLYGL